MISSTRGSVLTLLLLLVSFQVFAVPATPAMSGKEVISRALDELKKSSDKPLTDKEQQLKDVYQQTLFFLNLIKAENNQLNQLQDMVSNAPGVLADLQDQLKNLALPSDTALLEKHRHLPVDQLRKLMDTKLEQITELQNQLARIAGQITQGRARPETNQALISKNLERLKEIVIQINQLDNQTATNTPNLQQKKDRLKAESEALQQQDSRLNLEIRASGTLLDIDTARQRLLNRQAQLLEQEVLSLQTIINFKRRAASEQAVATASRLNRSSAGKAALLQAEAAENMELSQQLLTVSDRISVISAKNTKVRNQLANLDNIGQSVRQQSVLLGENRVLARMLRESLMTLPHVTLDRSIRDLISETRLQKFQYDQRRQNLAQPEVLLKELLAQQPQASFNQRDEAELLRLLNNRQKLLEDLSAEMGNLLSGATSLGLDQQTLYSRSRELSGTLEERLFWIASNQALGVDWFLRLPGAAWQQLAGIPWGSIAFALTDTFIDNWLFGSLLLVGCILLQARKRTLIAIQRTLTRKMGNVRHDTLNITPKALMLCLLQVLPLPLLTGILGAALRFGGNHGLSIVNLGDALITTAVSWLLLSLAIQVNKPHNIAVTHFRWPPQQCRSWCQRLTRLRSVMIPLLLLTSIAKDQPSDLNQDILGMSLLLAGSLAQGVILFRLMHAGNNLLGSRFLHILLTLVLIVMSLAQLGLTASGYYYTSLQLQELLAGTLYITGGAVLLQAMIIRSLQVAERRLAFTRALKRRAASKDGENIEEPSLDLATVSQQSLRLVNALVIVGLFIGLFWFWRDLFNLLNSLSGIRLWEFSAAQEGGSPTVVYLTDLLFSLITLVTSFILARNLPGLLEVTVLSRIKLRAGSSYAVTTLLSYTISCIGFITALSFLGASWDKLQWLVAALGLGIGIGLQEIVANFVAGLIILFERPVRLGDTITLGELNGVVTRIRIRATTVLDWDNREIIIPNKILMGEKLINWSLSSPVVRIILPFRVAHGTDPKLVQKILHQAAAEHERTVDTPPTFVILMEYSDSGLVYELRTHVMHVDDRLPVRDQLNARIQELFSENGVSIAYQKQDVYLHQTGSGHAG